MVKTKLGEIPNGYKFKTVKNDEILMVKVDLDTVIEGHVYTSEDMSLGVDIHTGVTYAIPNDMDLSLFYREFVK